MNDRRINDQDIFERYAERAAIMEFDGGMSRESATQPIFNAVAAWCKRNGLKFPQIVREDFRKVITGDRNSGDLNNDVGGTDMDP